MNAQMCDFIVFCNILINHDNVRYVQWLSFFGVAKSAPLRDLVCWLAREKTDPKDLVTTDRPAGSRFVVADTQDLNWSLGFTDLWWRTLHPMLGTTRPTRLRLCIYDTCAVQCNARTTGNTNEKEPSCELVPGRRRLCTVQAICNIRPPSLGMFGAPTSDPLRMAGF